MNTKLLREAAEWRLISLLFECPGEEWQKQIAGLAREVGDPTLKQAVEAAGKEADAALYYTTFGPGGPAAPREVSHRQTLMPGQMLDEIGAYYQAFAYQATIPEPPDHIAVMTGFIAYLRLKEALGTAEQAEITAKAARDFIENHLNVIAEPLAKSLKHSGITYLDLTAAALLQRVGPRRDSATPVEATDCSGCQFQEEETSL
jgi:nitrate reductase assembly molybdenum cofactor insertion protein NarJ